MVLLIAQASLVSGGRVDLHRRLGIGGMLLACLMVIVGVLAATDLLVRASGPPVPDPQFFYIVPMSSMLIFGTLIFFAFRARSNPPVHKRLILVATTALLTAAIVRWPFVIVHRNVPTAALFSYIFLLLLVAYDLWSTRKVHRATLWPGTFLLFVPHISPPIGNTSPCHSSAICI